MSFCTIKRTTQYGVHRGWSISKHFQRCLVHISSDIAHDVSIKDPEKYWGLQGSKIDWFKPFEKVVQHEPNGYGKWFVGGELNTCYNAVDRHIARGRSKQVAIIFDSPVTNTIEYFTYSEVLEEVQNVAGYLHSLGVRKGDNVVIYMPNIPQAAFAMLACARLGAVHCVVFGGFAANELAVRINDCRPKVVISASCGIDGAKVIDYKMLLDTALKIVEPHHAVEKCIVFQRPMLECSLLDGRDISWESAMKMAQTLPKNILQLPCTSLRSEEPLYILYTSGTTGAPKGVQRDNGGHAVALAHSMDIVYGISNKDVMWAASDVGWVVGHSYGVYGPLLAGATYVMYEGKPVGTPDAANFWRTIAKHKVNVFFTAPTAIRAMKKVDPNGNHAKQFDLSSLRSIHLAGEHADKDTLLWLEHATITPSHPLGVPVRDHWWQTETGWPICADQLDQINHKQHKVANTIHGSTYKPCPGFNLQLFDMQHEDHEAHDSNHAVSQKAYTPKRVVSPYKQAQIFLKLPLPPGALTTLYNAPQRFESSYLSTLPGYYDTGDAGYMDEQGNVFVMARTDDVLNVAGHRLSSGALEEAVCLHEDVAEAAVVGLKDHFKGQIPLGLIVLNEGVSKSNAVIVEELITLVRDRIGPVASFKHIAVVARLPKTRSGKTLRATLRQIANGEPIKVPATVEDIGVLDEITAIIQSYLVNSHPANTQSP
mmetsp:Transcript_2191/g.1556  ORF Transcript_2191/g.1556 Transcript_2191/m.1556 type:complete len:710 (+) Transcript_2191:34-2163(+)